MKDCDDADVAVLRPCPGNRVRLPFIDGWNDRAHPFVWTKATEDILEKADRRDRKTTPSTRH